MDVFKQLFHRLGIISPPAEAEDRLLLKEPVRHNALFLMEYQQWKTAGLHHSMLRLLQEYRMLKESNPKSRVNFIPHREKASSGFFFQPEEDWSSREMRFLCNYFQQKVEDFGYRLTYSRREVDEKDGQLWEKEVYYLKPALKYRRETPANQLYGNVHLEHRLQDGQSKLLKCMVFPYTDRMYSRAEAYGEFLDRLLDTEEA
jgi:hypothetical protein